MSIRATALGVAACDADHRVRESGGNNRGPRIRQYLENLDPPIAAAAPWCAAAVQYWSDVAARVLGTDNPLDAVRLEALVQSYYDEFGHLEVAPYEAEPGDLVLFEFGDAGRWNHIGLLAQPPNPQGHLWTVEGNTSDQNQRDGDAVVVKPRDLNAGYPVVFLTWGDGERIE